MAGVNAPVDDFSKIIPDTSEPDMSHKLYLKTFTPEEWRLLISDVAAYQYNAHCQALHMPSDALFKA